MAKRRSATRTIVRTVQAPARPTTIKLAIPRATAAARHVGRAVRRHAPRAARAVGRAASSEKHTLTALGASAALALAENHGYSTIVGLPTDATGGIGAWLLGRFTKNPMATHAATGLLCIALYKRVKAGSVSVSGGTAVAYD